MDVAIGALMGMVYIAAPGPVNVETIRRGLDGGTGAALAIQIGAGLGHVVYACIALLGLGVLIMHATVHLCLGLAGTGLLVYLGWSALRAGWGGRAATVRQRDTADWTARQGAGHRMDLIGRCSLPISRRALGLGAAISLTNPFAMAFWLSVGGTVLHQAHRNGALFLAGFFLSVLLWAMGLPLLIGRGRSAAQGRFFDWVSMACGLALILFGFALGHTLVAVAA